MCTYAVKPRNYEVFERTAKKRTFLTFFGEMVTIAMADTPKLELRVCVKVKCESFETCYKCTQNVWGYTNVQKHQFLTILGGSYHSNGEYFQFGIMTVCRSQM